MSVGGWSLPRSDTNRAEMRKRQNTARETISCAGGADVFVRVMVVSSRWLFLSFLSLDGGFVNLISELNTFSTIVVQFGLIESSGF